MDYEITPLDDLDDAQVARLHGELISTHPGWSRRYLRWKYGSNPFIEDPIIQVIRLAGEVVGMRGVYGSLWNLEPGAPPVVLPHADDLIIAEEHRNRGLFLPLHQALVGAARERGYDAIISLSGGVATQELSLVCGYRVLGDLNKLRGQHGGPRLRRRIVGRVAREVRRRVPVPPVAMWGTVPFDVVRHVRSADDGHLHLERDIAPEELAGVAGRRPVVPASARTAEYYRWRLGNPDRVTRTLTWRDGSLRGFVVVSWDLSSPHTLTIADHAAEDVSILDHLLASIGSIDGVDVVATPPADADELAVFERHGFEPFVDEPEWLQRRFLYFPLTDKGELDRLAPFPSGWRFSLLDGMAA